MYKYIQSMAVPRRTTLTQIERYDTVMCEHLLKLILYSDIRPNDINGWLNSISNALYELSKISSKGGNLTYEDYYDHAFGEFGENREDVENTIRSYKQYFCYKLRNSEKGSYPEFEIDENLVDYVANILDTFRIWSSSLLSNTDNMIDRSTIKSELKTMLKDDCYLSI